MKWNNVKDCLPTKRGLYLVFNGAVVFTCDNVLSQTEGYPCAINNNGFDWPCKITHWMSLPVAPANIQQQVQADPTDSLT